MLRIRQTAGPLGLLIVLVGFTLALGNVTGQNTLSLSFSRTFGMALGGTMQGTFTLQGSGPEEVVGLIVYFNGVEVHSVESNSMSWIFNTGDYPAGATNITLYGWDEQNATYLATSQVSFLGAMTTNLIYVGIGALVITLAVLKYGPILKNRKTKS